MRSAEIAPGNADGLRRRGLTDPDEAIRDPIAAWRPAAGRAVMVDRVAARDISCNEAGPVELDDTPGG